MSTAMVGVIVLFVGVFGLLLRIEKAEERIRTLEVEVARLRSLEPVE